MVGCETLYPSETPCFRGICVNQTCICDAGWSKPRGFIWADEVCSLHKETITRLYEAVKVLSLLILLALLVILSFKTRSWRKFISATTRALPGVVSASCFCLTAFLKTDTQQDLYVGEDVFLTFSASTGGLLAFVSGVVVATKYRTYLSKTHQVSSKRSLIKIFGLARKVIFVLGFLGFGAVVLAAKFPAYNTFFLRIFGLFCGLGSLGIVVLMKTMKMVLKDLEQALGLTVMKTGYVGKGLRASQITTKFISRIWPLLLTISIFVCILGAVFPMCLHLLQPFLPIWMILGEGSMLMFILEYMYKRYVRQKLNKKYHKTVPSSMQRQGTHGLESTKHSNTSGENHQEPSSSIAY